MASKMSKRFTGFLGRSKSIASQPNPGVNNDYNYENAPADSPEANVRNAIRLFCESGSMSTGGEEVLHLPTIVGSSESSPSAAAAAAQQIRKFLTREWSVKPYIQYNAIMLIRILSDNPGPSFTRNFDKAFVSTVKELLRNCKDSSTQQILRETLDNLEVNKQFQEGMDGLTHMWRKEKGQQASLGSRNIAPRNDYAYQGQTGGMNQQRPHDYGRQHSGRRQLPPPIELASRIEEARNTAKILLQLIQSTPPEEVLHNELLREFSERCESAHKSMKGYISCDSPPPDDDTMLTLIETNEQLSLATTRYQRSLLNARKAMGVMTPSPNAEAMQRNGGPVGGPPALGQGGNVFGNSTAPSRQFTNQSAFSHPGETYTAPMGPPPQRQSPPTVQQSLPSMNNNEAFQSPSGPPPSMLARLDSRESPSQGQYKALDQSPRLVSPAQSNDPFADPVEHSQNASSAADQNPAHRPHSQTFSVDAGPTYAPAGAVPAASYTSPRSQWHDSGATPSYVGRQTSAVNGLTMHGAQSHDDVPEIDGHSEVGRNDGGGVGRSNTNATDTSSAYSISPLESRYTQYGSR